MCFAGGECVRRGEQSSVHGDVGEDSHERQWNIPCNRYSLIGVIYFIFDCIMS